MSFEDIDDTTEKHERRIVRCRTCRARIIFLPTAKGKSMPVDADTVELEDDEFNSKKHTSHFSTCSDPEKHRRPR